MEEILEILIENGEQTGKKISKTEAHRNGICHGISAVALVNNNGKLLIQKRSNNKKIEPGKWDLSGAGHIDYNENPKQAAIREIYEEIGIKLELDELTQIDTYLNKVKLDDKTFINHFTYLFIVKKDIDINNLIIQKNEVDNISFVDKKEFVELINNKKMVESIKYCHKILDYMK